MAFLVKAPGSPRPAVAAIAAEVICWWAACTGIWLLTLSAVSVPELVTALACALPSALAARAGRHAMSARWQPRAQWVAWLIRLPASVTADTARLFGAACRWVVRPDGTGELRDVQLPHEAAPVAGTRRALASLVLSATPGTLVVDTNPEEDKLVIHSLVNGPPKLDEVVQR
ncbi:MAG TPA: hypothetical protein VG253_25115 [Streptosporangiaceae bacterium]|nr:hypothetical protein [Streptosporangiaceae bacterium]